MKHWRHTAFLRNSQAEFVTSGYFGFLPGDPDGGKTRVVTQNNAGPTFWVGKQEAVRKRLVCSRVESK